LAASKQQHTNEKDLRDWLFHFYAYLNVVVSLFEWCQLSAIAEGGEAEAKKASFLYISINSLMLNPVLQPLLLAIPCWWLPTLFVYIIS
jgi:hypothetical protein